MREEQNLTQHQVKLLEDIEVRMQLAKTAPMKAKKSNHTQNRTRHRHKIERKSKTNQ